MSDFSVSPDAVGHTVRSTAAVADGLRAELAALRREADAVLTGQWRGRAAAAFDRAWCSWDGGAAEVIAGLDRLAELLAVTARDYLERDDVSSCRLRLAAS